MEGWSEGQLVLFDAMSKICDSIEEKTAIDAAHSITQSGGRQFIRELGALRDRATKVEKLQEENERLRAELADALQKLEAADKATSKQVSRDQPTVRMLRRHPDEHAGESERYEALTRKYNELYKNHELSLTARKQLESKGRELRKSRDDYILYSDKIARKLAKLEKKFEDNGMMKNGSFTGSTMARSFGSVVEGSPGREGNFEGETLLGTPATRVTHLVVSDLDTSIDNEAAESTELPHLKPSLNETLLEIQNNPARSDENNGSSTQGETEDTDTHNATEQVDTPKHGIKVESPDDTPIVVFSRSVRKIKYSGQASKAKIKIEASPSSPATHPAMREPQESLDLDDIGEKIATPKKLRRPEPEVLPQQVKTYEDWGNSIHVSGNASALQPASPNKQILPRTSSTDRPNKRRRLDPRGVAIFSEDGENHSTALPHQVAGNSLKFLQGNSPELVKRLSGLLEVPSPHRQMLTSGSKGKPAKSVNTLPTNNQGWYSRRDSAEHDQIHPQPNPLSRIIRDNHSVQLHNQPFTPATVKNSDGKNQSRRALETTNDFSLIDHGDEPLRSRPVRNLGLHHFKVNPNYNQGYEYAFTDVVRGREQRKCLPGCTKPECCGNTFRKLVELTTMDDGKQTASQEELDRRLLEEFMGDNKGQLRHIPNSEKKELLLQAKTRQMANRHSKHRQAYERRRSPPGFWRTDFPSTQEVEADRTEAARVQREIVQQRYDEAIRGRGRWIFKDE